MKFTVTKAANGWIVRVISWGSSSGIKEFHTDKLFIFFEMKDLAEFMESQSK